MKLLGWSEWCYVVTMWCTITPSCALQDAKTGFGRCLTKWNPKFEFVHAFFEISDQIGTAWCWNIILYCDCAPLCQIWSHLNNARWINGPQVVKTWIIHIFWIFFIFLGYLHYKKCANWRHSILVTGRSWCAIYDHVVTKNTSSTVEGHWRLTTTFFSN